MTVASVHYKVDDGDMTLMTLESGRRILTDINIREPGDDIPDVAEQLRERLEELGRDSAGRLYVDAFLLTHPDEDHIRGLMEHFHLGDPSSWSKKADKILIREMWSSPIVFRRASKYHVLCDDACGWSAEARRRVQMFKDGKPIGDGNRIKILGEDINGKTDNLGAILVKTEQSFSTICGAIDTSFEARLFAPLVAKDDEEEEVLTKNNSSVVMRLDLNINGKKCGRYLVGGDAEVGVWERIWDRNEKQSNYLNYDVLIAPHHCSWHSLSWDSWSKLGEKVKVSPKARKALGQALPGAIVIASSKTISDDDSDPPCVRAKREYLDILKPQNGEFRCVADGAGDAPLVIEVWGAGPKIKRVAASVTFASVTTGLGSQPLAHGECDD